MFASPLISLIVPTRRRMAQLNAFLESVIGTAATLDYIEVVLVIDDDDSESMQVDSQHVSIRRVIVPHGSTMGALNTAGYNASKGRFVMLLNDDVICRTPGWDAKILACFRACSDDILLVHVNDTLMKTALCTFPVVSRTFCEIAGGICRTEYIRYRIDDHIEDIFNFLGVLGERRTVYLPGVVFEHQNYEERTPGLRQYFSDDGILARDAPTFERLLGSRKQTALQLRSIIEKNPTTTQKRNWTRLLDRVTDSFALRVPDRLRVLHSFSVCDVKDLERRIRMRLPETTCRDTWKNIVLRNLNAARECYRRGGLFGVAQMILGKSFQLSRDFITRSRNRSHTQIDPAGSGLSG